MSCAPGTYTFEMAGSPSDLLAAFRTFYGPTMNAFEAADKTGRADNLQRELEALFNYQNTSVSAHSTSITTTFLRVTVTVV